MPARSTLPEPGAAIWHMSCVVALLALGALAALGGAFVLRGALNADEGFYLLASRFVADGLRPFRDFGFTQTPLAPYASVPWLALFGYNLTGLRLAGLGWTMVAVTTGVVVLRRRQGWISPAIFVLLLLGSPGWLAWATKGKTYAFSSVAVVLGAIALTMDGLVARRWALFIAAAAIGVTSRLTTVGFFLPAGIGLLAFTPGARARTTAITVTAVVGTTMLLFATAGAWDNFWFWTARFHAASTIQAPLGERLLGLFALAPATWVALIATLVLAARARKLTDGVALVALVCGLGANVLLPHGYAEYATTFVPAVAWIAAPALVAGTVRRRILAVVAATIATAGGTWLRPPGLSPNVLAEAEAASAFLSEHTQPGAVVVASMPEIPIAAGCTVPAPLAMGKFALTESLSPAEAEQRLLLTPAVLAALIADPGTQALVLSPAERWSFSWSVPDYHYLSKRSRTMIFTAVERDYELAYTNSEYVIFLRKHRDEQSPE